MIKFYLIILNKLVTIYTANRVRYGNLFIVVILSECDYIRWY